MGKTLLVTGGAGFIGSNFVESVAGTGFDIVVVDKLTYAGRRENVGDASFIQADIADRYAMRDIFGQLQPEYVVNFAAETHVDRSIDDPTLFVYTNLCGTFELLEAARKHPPKKFLQVSTDEVYGSTGIVETPFAERDPYDPSSPYAATKAGADLLALSYFKTYGLPVLVTNASNTYGPRQYPEKLIPLMIRNALAGKPLPIYGDGKNVRDWLYVEDHCFALQQVLLEGKVGQKYNIGGGDERTNVEVVDMLCDILGPGYRALKIFVPDRLGHDRRYSVDSSKVRQLGWTPVWDFKTGLENTVNWYREHSS
jgi:dTDP-glucose 4,6-dehydratase